jgi:putative ABC transport system permease protein
MLWETLLLASQEIRRNVLRSSLTILGIVIGVAAVITMVTLGNGATAQVTADIGKLGSNLLQIRPGQRPNGPGGTRAVAELFDLDDAEAIVRETSGLEAVAPTASRSTQAIFGNQNWSTTVSGSDNAYLEVKDLEIEAGRAFTDSEIGGGKAVCILGATVHKELFGAQDPLGTTIRLEKLSCQVIGVFQSKGQSGFGSDQDDFILVPLRTFQRRIAGNQDVSAIYVSVRDGVSTEKIEKDIALLMRERRRISKGEPEDFSVTNMEQVASTLSGATTVLTSLLGAVAGVSLLVGGIGIMNIMLVSVTERTREIGIRLAIGALEQEVLTQFLVEAVVLTSFGGLVGVILGIAGSAFLAPLLGVPFVLDPNIAAVAFLFSAGVGLVFGYFPARRAARLDPIEALRHE